jgi:hypothetical protein
VSGLQRNDRRAARSAISSNAPKIRAPFTPVAIIFEPHCTMVSTQDITRAILVLRGHRVLLDTELASLYGVATKRFNEQVRRNRKRFPPDFMFQLTAEEISSLRSQIAALKLGRGQHRKYLPYVFTEHGAIMAATILNSSRAVEINEATDYMWRRPAADLFSAKFAPVSAT